MIAGIEIFGVELPLWAIFFIGIIVVILAWKLIKFAFKILLIALVVFVILIGLDFFNVFNWIQNLFAGVI
jgi:hypothetical protein